MCARLRNLPYHNLLQTALFKIGIFMKTCVEGLLTGDFYKALLDSIFDAVYTVDVNGNIVYWNESCARITGYSAREMLGRRYNETNFSCNANGEHNPEERNSNGIAIVLKTGMPGTWRGYVQRKNGQRIPVQSHVSVMHNPSGEIVGAVEVFRDISAHVSLEEAHRQVLQVSRKDQLTGLYNRTAITALFKAEIERSRRYNQPLAAIMMDIDHFKRVNDRYGHDAGDRVLAKIGSILLFNLRKPDAVGRWGGEEFLIIAPGDDLAAAEQLAERVRQYVEAISSIGVPEHITASFGVAQLQPDQGQDQLLYVADMALYKAKTAGRNQVAVGYE